MGVFGNRSGHSCTKLAPLNFYIMLVNNGSSDLFFSLFFSIYWPCPPFFPIFMTKVLTMDFAKSFEA